MSINNLPEEEQSINPAENQEASNLMDSIKDQAENLQTQAEEKLEEFKGQRNRIFEKYMDAFKNIAGIKLPGFRRSFGCWRKGGTRRSAGSSMGAIDRSPPAHETEAGTEHAKPSSSSPNPLESNAVPDPQCPTTRD